MFVNLSECIVCIFCNCDRSSFLSFFLFFFVFSRYSLLVVLLTSSHSFVFQNLAKAFKSKKGHLVRDSDPYLLQL